jgi:hypothetical protein
MEHRSEFWASAWGLLSDLCGSFVGQCGLTMMSKGKEDDLSVGEKRHPVGGLFLPSLVVSYFATSPLGILTGLFLLRMAESFGVSKGVMGQINAVSSVVAVVFAFVFG